MYTYLVYVVCEFIQSSFSL